MDRERRVTYQVIAQGQLAGITLTAPSLQRLFIDAALALSDYRISLDLVKDSNQLKVSVQGDSLEKLAIAWLNAVAGLFNKDGFLPYRIVFTAFDAKRIEATLTGETYQSHRHGYPRPFQGVPGATFRLSPTPDDHGQVSASFYLSTENQNLIPSK